MNIFDVSDSSEFQVKTVKNAVIAYIATVFTIVAHCVFGVVFGILKIPELLFLNVSGVIIYIIVLCGLCKTHSFLLFYSIGALEVIVNEIICIWFLGLETGFQYYIVLVSVLPFLITTKESIYTIVCSIFSIAVFIMMELFFYHADPIYNLSTHVIRLFKIINCGLSLILVAVVSYIFTTAVVRMEQVAKKQYDRAEKLIGNILPSTLSRELKEEPKFVVQKFNSISVMFLDIVGFTALSAQVGLENLVYLLNELFSEFDDQIDEYEVEKIRTVGNTYMVASGVPHYVENNEEELLRYAICLRKVLARFNDEHNIMMEVRIGIHCGPVVAGIIGSKKYIYDMWGATVRHAYRLETDGVPGKIQVSAKFYEKLKDVYSFDKRSGVVICDLGEFDCYLLRSATKIGQ